MSARTVRDLIILVLIFGAIWGAFSLIKFPKIDVDLSIPLETEEELGEMLMESYLEQSVEVKDSVVLNALYKITDRLENSLDSSNFIYKFYVIENEQVNAFATLGGNVVVFTGLLKLTDSPEEVAAVLAHEMGHVEERHVSKMLVKQLGIGVVMSVLTGGDPALILEILEMSASSAFSRNHETEADDFGLKLLEKSNISPSSMATIFRKMKKHANMKYEKELEFISSHPETDKRIRKSIKYKTQKNFKSEPFDIDWSEVKEAIR